MKCGYDTISKMEKISNGATREKIIDGCENGLYRCMSNYFVRQFSGYRTGVNGTVTREMLEAAKRNYLRYSCVLIQEAWDITMPCLLHRLGMPLSFSGGFNQGGNIKAREDTNNTEVLHQNETFTETFSQAELSRLYDLNSLDIEFYEWAKEHTLSEATAGWH